MYVFSSGSWVAACWEVAARSACGEFSGCGCLIVDFFRLGFWSGGFFLVVLFPDRCLLVPFVAFSIVVYSI